MGRAVKDLNPFWQAVICAVLAILVMRCWSEEGEQKPLDLFVVKRTLAAGKRMDTNQSATNATRPQRRTNEMSEQAPVPVKGDDEDTDPDRKPGPMREDDPIHYF